MFVTVDNTGSSHEPVTNFFGLKDAKAPQARAAKPLCALYWRVGRPPAGALQGGRASARCALVPPARGRPQVIGFFMEKNRKYKLKEEFSQEALKAFTAGVLDGTAEVRCAAGWGPWCWRDGEGRRAQGRERS